MKNEELWETYSKRLKADLNFLPDKPEETIESTLRSLWLAATGRPASAQKALTLPLPELTTGQRKALDELVGQRIAGVPLAHLTKRQQFMGVELLSGPEALVPRKETELLGFAALERLQEMGSQEKRTLWVMDVCTGAGNLAVALRVLYPNIQVFAADLSPQAVRLATENVKFNQLESSVDVRISDVLDAFDSGSLYNKIDLLICNPPYISSAKVPEMPDEISGYEPGLAFDGGPFGIKILSKLTRDAPKYLRIGGWLGFEVGLGQGPAMKKRLTGHKQFDDIQTVLDNAGQIRALFAKRIA